MTDGTTVERISDREVVVTRVVNGPVAKVRRAMMSSNCSRQVTQNVPWLPFRAAATAGWSAIAPATSK